MIRAAGRLAVTWSVLPLLAFAAAPADPWVRIQSANFELFTTAGERAGRDLARHFEQVRGFFLEVFKAQSTDGKPVRIVAFHNEKEFQPYRPSEAAAAFFHSGADHDYIVISGTAIEYYQVATHEYTHLLLGQTGGAIPLWLNEGLAELYSTIDQAGGRILVGKAPPGRAETLRNDRWIDLDALLSVTHESPLYNRKAHAGMFYAESWALVHMLSLDPAYRPHLSAMLDALKTAGSAEAFDRVYGKPLAQVERDLRAYVNAQTLRGLAFRVALAPAVESPAIEPHSSLLARLALAELLSDYPGKTGEASAAYLQVARDFPQRREVEAALGRFEWRERRNQEALSHFAHAIELGADDPRMFVAYGRTLGVANRSQEAAAALRTAIKLEPSLKEAHYDLGLLLVRTGEWRDALAELRLAGPVNPQQAPRYFYSIAYSEYRLGETIAARNHLEQVRPYTKIPSEVAALDRLSQALGPPVVEGVLETIECQGKLARLHVRMGDSVRTFLIPDLTAAKGLACGPQPGARVRLEFQAMPMGSAAADGLVRTLEFQ